MPSPALVILLRRRAALSPFVAPYDVIAALQSKWVGNPSLVAVSARLYLNKGPKPTVYPFCVLSQVAEKPTLNTGLGYWETKVLQFAIYHTDADALGTLGDTLTSSFDPLNRTKALSFANGYLKRFRRKGGLLLRMPDLGPGGQIVYQQSYAYIVEVGRTQGAS